MRFGIVPREPPVQKGLDGVAPALRRQIEAVLADVPDAVIAESLRTRARCEWLYGFGRMYDDGRGLVTHATYYSGWHPMGLAVDCVHRVHGWDASPTFWQTLGDAAQAHGLTWGGRWKMRDLPHVQWGGMPATPQAWHHDAMHDGTVESVWALVKAV
jgi:hypothetical protein